MTAPTEGKSIKCGEIFTINIEKATLSNTNYRQVLYTNLNQQVVLMKLNAGEAIGNEVHNFQTQFIRIEAGLAYAIIGEGSKEAMRYSLTDGDVIVIPAGTPHNIVAVRETKLYTIYSPPTHPPGTIHKTKADDKE